MMVSMSIEDVLRTVLPLIDAENDPLSLVIEGDRLVADPYVFRDRPDVAEAVTATFASIALSNAHEWAPAAVIALRAPQMDGTMVRFDPGSVQHFLSGGSVPGLAPHTWFCWTKNHTARELGAFARDQHVFDLSRRTR